VDDRKDFKFPDDFLDEIAVSRDVDPTFISKLAKLTPDQREELATLILERDARRFATN